MNGINVIGLFFFGSAWLQIVQSDTLVEARSTMVSVTHKPSDDTIILHQTGIRSFPKCLAECNRHENCSTIVFQEGAGCTLYNSSRLTEPLAPGEEAASVTARDMMYRPEVDECSSSPCQNGGTCEDQVNAYSCSCMPGFMGVSCETDIEDICDAPFMYNELLHGCYSAIQPPGRNFVETQAYCSSLHKDAYVIEIDSVEENNFLATAMLSIGQTMAWLGAERNSKTEPYYWKHSGQMMTFEMWHPREPNTEENLCLLLFIDSIGSQKWADGTCGFTSRAYVCEYDL